MQSEKSRIDEIINHIRMGVKRHSTAEYWDGYFQAATQIRFDETFSLTEFLKYDGEDFIYRVFRALLQRDPSPENIQYFSKKLSPSRPLRGKLKIIRALLSTPEIFQSGRLVRVSGLPQFASAFDHFLNSIPSNLIFMLLLVFEAKGLIGWSDFKYFYKELQAGKVQREDIVHLVRYIYSTYMSSSLLRFAARALRFVFRRFAKVINLFSREKGLSADQLLEIFYVAEYNQRIALQKESEELNKKIDFRADQLAKQINYLQDQLSRGGSGVSTSVMKVTSPSESFNSKVYQKFEDRFRGSEIDIRNRLEESYMNQVAPLFEGKADSLALDIGFGRCEWMSLLRDRGYQVQGVDMNPDLVESARHRGFAVYSMDAVEYIKSLNNDSLTLITGFHIVEHIPMDSLLELFRESYRVLKPGGMIIFETPNPENLLVGSFEFWIDPSHIKPIPSQTLQFLMQSVGFSNAEVQKKNPYMLLDPAGIENQSLQNIVYRFNLEKDYAVVATK